jgi:cytosine/adenosine deaminase-related metal-dependent hydrolase
MLLLRNGHVIDTEPQPTAHPKTDVLLHADRIVEVGRNLAAPPGTEVIDASDRIVLPGFVDTHRHLWQTSLRCLLPDTDLGEYLTTILGELGPRFTPTEMYTSEHLGARECLASGITTVTDYSRPQLTPNLAEAALTALRDVGIRAIFAYDGDGSLDQVAGLRRTRTKHDSELLTLALASLGPEYGGVEHARNDWRAARELGMRVMFHCGASISALHDNGLLGHDVLYVHANGLAREGFEQIAATGGGVSVCPTIETVMGHGLPVTNEAHAASVATGLGADVVTSGPGDMFSVMRAAYMFARTQGKGITTADVLRMATLGGATAIGLGDTIGSLRPGKQADIVMLRTDTPGMVAAHDPVGAVVLAADTSSVDTVIVAGRVVLPHLP